MKTTTIIWRAESGTADGAQSRGPVVAQSRDLVGIQSGPSRGTQSLDPVTGLNYMTLANDEWSLAERIVLACEEPKSVKDLLALVGRTNRTKFKQRFLGTLRIDGILEWTVPDKPNSRLQKYRLTAKGRNLVASLKKKGGEQ